MDLGAFSVSLTVSDLEASMAFYTALGFSPVGGEVDDGWVIMANGRAVIGLFHGMFEENILTFNPGLDALEGEVEIVDDVRDIEASLREAGITPVVAVDPSTTGPGHFVVVDPDGNRIMVDQFR